MTDIKRGTNLACGDLVSHYTELRRQAVPQYLVEELGNRVVDVLRRDINPAHAEVPGFIAAQALAESLEPKEDPAWPYTPDVDDTHDASSQL